MDILLSLLLRLPPIGLMEVAQQAPRRGLPWGWILLILLLLALVIVWVIMTVALIAGTVVSRVLGRRGVAAVQKLMGMILTVVSIQLFVAGIEAYLASR